MPTPVVIRPVRQHTPYACTLASLSAVIGRDYEDVYDYALRLYGERLDQGLYTPQVRRIAKHFKTELVVHRAWREDSGLNTGILYVRKADTNDHAVVLFGGIIYDPMDGQLWEPEAFLASHPTRRRARFGSLLAVGGSL